MRYYVCAILIPLYALREAPDFELVRSVQTGVQTDLKLFGILFDCNLLLILEHFSTCLIIEQGWKPHQSPLRKQKSRYLDIFRNWLGSFGLKMFQLLVKLLPNTSCLSHHIVMNLGKVIPIG